MQLVKLHEYFCRAPSALRQACIFRNGSGIAWMHVKSNTAPHCEHYGVEPLPHWWTLEGDVQRVDRDMHPSDASIPPDDLWCTHRKGISITS